MRLCWNTNYLKINLKNLIDQQLFILYVFFKHMFFLFSLQCIDCILFPFCKPCPWFTLPFISHVYPQSIALKRSTPCRYSSVISTVPTEMAPSSSPQIELLHSHFSTTSRVSSFSVRLPAGSHCSRSNPVVVSAPVDSKRL